MLVFLQKHPEKIYKPLLEHVQLVVITLLVSVAIAVLLTVLSMQYQKLGQVLMNLFSVIYSIPSLALFALLIPVTGLGRTTAVVVLTVYNQYLLLRNFITGLNEVDPAVREAAAGIGLTRMQMLLKVQVPLAKKAILAGIRLAVLSTTGIGTIAASINAGGLGTLLFDGLRTMNTVKILWGSLLSAALAILLNAMLKLAE
jgi:osmoprotectant transport system permease protein